VEAPHRQLCFKHITPMPAHPETPMIGFFRRTPALSSIGLRPGLNWRRQVSPDFGARRRPSNEHENMLSKPLKSLLEVVPCDRCQATGARRQVPIQFSFNSIQFQFSSVQFSSIRFNSVQFTSVQFNSVQFNSVSIQFNSIPISIQFNSVQFRLDAYADDQKNDRE
jgi:hypothetical protein